MINYLSIAQKEPEGRPEAAGGGEEGRGEDLENPGLRQIQRGGRNHGVRTWAPIIPIGSWARTGPPRPEKFWWETAYAKTMFRRSGGLPTKGC